MTLHELSRRDVRLGPDALRRPAGPAPGGPLRTGPRAPNSRRPRCARGAPYADLRYPAATRRACRPPARPASRSGGTDAVAVARNSVRPHEQLEDFLAVFATTGGLRATLRAMETVSSGRTGPGTCDGAHARGPRHLRGRRHFGWDTAYVVRREAADRAGTVRSFAVSFARV
ncbi:hypothetical protein SSPO_002220 [Streptomyces antimycoticus]|uniref:Uncharacterized protein n=1 Tax=Streptomyces antimycoticus TaxID=68175 RepID=A0A499U9Z4_9ACTN|nr:hypothetical protein SSPO_002220 [Streptomyces antimycoticus]